jgi:hypothetical protein
MDVSSLQRNHLLSLLKPEVQQRLLPLLTLVSIDIGEILAEADRITSTVYFPLSLVASSLRTTEDGVTVEMITVGNEGFVGLPLLLGSGHDPLRCIVQIDGEGLTMSAEDFIDTIEDGTTGLRNILLLYTQAALNQVIHNATCNRVHSIAQRCARWILMTQDRVQKESFILGGNFVSYMLAAPEAAVTSAMGTLSKANLLTYVGGKIHVLNRPHLSP